MDIDLNAVADFNLVATHGGFGKASRVANRPKATLSRRVAELERQLGVRLIERGAHRLELTEAGRLLLAGTKSAMHDLADAATAAREGQSTPRGVLRVGSPVLFSQLALGQLCAKFLVAYPELQLDVVVEDREVDLVAEHFDAVIRVNPRIDSPLVGRCFAKDRLVVVAAPGVPMPTTRANEPMPVPAVVMAALEQRQKAWSLDGGRLTLEPVPALRLSSFLMIRGAALAGAGAAVLPQSVVWSQLARGELVQWGVLVGKEIELWVQHTSRRHPSPKVRAFVEFMCAQYPSGSLVLHG
jgi:DNA-binding transcriptional LysR family regulator